MLEQVEVEFNGFKFSYFKNDDMAGGSIGKNKEWETHITRFVKAYNKNYNIKNIIDVGANFGYHTIFFSKEVSENVYGFEPQHQNYQLLEYNIKNNNVSNAIIYNLACGNDKCDVKMPIIQTTNQVNMGDFTPNIITTKHYSITKSILLDEFDFPQIDLIKIDVQGWEKLVLLGSSKLLTQYKPTLIVEFEYFQLSKTNTTCNDLFNYIRSQNYYIFYLEYEYPSDHVCVHNDNLKEFRHKFKNNISNHNVTNWVNDNVNNGVTEKIGNLV